MFASCIPFPSFLQILWCHLRKWWWKQGYCKTCGGVPWGFLVF